MKFIKHLSIWSLALVVLLSGLGFSTQTAQAATCTRYHTVKWGESLWTIGRAYNVDWTYLAEINNLKRPYTIYSGQKLCVSETTGGGNVGQGGQPVATGAWSYSITGVKRDQSVTVQTSNFPDNVFFAVQMGRLKSGGGYEWLKVADLDTDKGGAYKQVFTIPAQFAGANQLVLRMTQSKKNGDINVDRYFYNGTQYGIGGIPSYYPGYYWGIPTFSIASVNRDTSVTITTYNFPSGLIFDVYMGPMGSRGVGGYHVGTLDSGSGGSLTATYSIPAALQGDHQIAIRTQNSATGYFSYNWFYNNTYP